MASSCFDALMRQLKRRDSPRTLLGPRLVADYLTNNGVFMYEGEKYVDVEHRTANENMLKRFMAKGLVGAMRWVHPTTQTLADVVDTLHYYPLSADYEFALADVVRGANRRVLIAEDVPFH